MKENTPLLANTSALSSTVVDIILKSDRENGLYYVTYVSKMNNKLHSYDDRPAEVIYRVNIDEFKQAKILKDNFTSLVDIDGILRRLYLREPHIRKWYINGKLHRANDLPAIVYDSGRRDWYSCGALHRENDLPAVIYENGDCEWYINGLLHRECDMPALDYKIMKCYFYKGKLHRANDMPAVVTLDGEHRWYVDGMLSREGDKPAVISDTIEQYYWHGVLHRANDKPAEIIKCNNCVLIKRYYRHGLLHRDNDKPAVTNSNGICEWYYEGMITRTGILMKF